MVPESERKLVPESYAREYWAWVDSELDQDWDDHWEFGEVEPGPMTEG